MRFTVIERARTWRRVDNHLDARHCPLCHATVHGNRGQHAHLDWHTKLAAQLEHVPDAVENGAEEPWTAAVDQADNEQQEAADERLQTGLQRNAQPHSQARTCRRPARCRAHQIVPEHPPDRS